MFKPAKIQVQEQPKKLEPSNDPLVDALVSNFTISISHEK